MTKIEYVVYCTTHKHYLRFVGPTGATWGSSANEAKRYATRRAARKDAERATWRGHTPTPWIAA